MTNLAVKVLSHGVQSAVHNGGSEVFAVMAEPWRIRVARSSKLSEAALRPIESTNTKGSNPSPDPGQGQALRFGRAVSNEQCVAWSEASGEVEPDLPFADTLEGKVWVLRRGARRQSLACIDALGSQ